MPWRHPSPKSWFEALLVDEPVLYVSKTTPANLDALLAGRHHFTNITFSCVIRPVHGGMIQGPCTDPDSPIKEVQINCMDLSLDKPNRGTNPSMFRAHEEFAPTWVLRVRHEETRSRAKATCDDQGRFLNLIFLALSLSFVPLLFGFG